MHITSRTDYALRLLMFLGTYRRRGTVPEAAAALQISDNHLFKVAAQLRDLGYVKVVRGRNGGVELAMAPEDIVVGDVFRDLESCTLVECFDPQEGRCVLSSCCELTKTFDRALAAFHAELNKSTLKDLVRRRSAMRAALGGERI